MESETKPPKVNCEFLVQACSGHIVKVGLPVQRSTFESRREVQFPLMIATAVSGLIRVHDKHVFLWDETGSPLQGEGTYITADRALRMFAGDPACFDEAAFLRGVLIGSRKKNKIRAALFVPASQMYIPPMAVLQERFVMDKRPKLSDNGYNLLK